MADDPIPVEETPPDPPVPPPDPDRVPAGTPGAPPRKKKKPAAHKPAVTRDVGASDRADDSDLVLRYKGRRDAKGKALDVIATEYGALEPRDLTRADTRTMIRTRPWLTAVLESGVYDPIPGTRIDLPDPEQDARD
jgi:hypothetical protein